jgi:tRNA-binding EMAP/Myf-like protein
MTVMVMEVRTVKNHSNAEALRIYEMAAPACDSLQIIANQEQVYQVGDHVAVALVNSVLKDGTKIKVTKLRGLQSYGMALGLVEAAVGSDLTVLYCQPEMLQTVELRRWPSIELLHNVTPNRLEQGVNAACGGQFDLPLIGKFLKWVAEDVQKESAAELEAAQLTWKDVNKAVTKAAKDWYQAKATSL